MLSAVISRLAKLLLGNKSQIVHMYHYLGDTLKCVFRRFHREARTSFFVTFILNFATIRLLLQYFLTATEEFSEPAVVSLCKLSTVRSWPFCNVTSVHCCRPKFW